MKKTECSRYLLAAFFFLVLMSPCRAAVDDEVLLVKKLQANPAVRGAIASRVANGETCEKIHIESSQYEEEYKATVFKAPIACRLGPDSSGDGGGIATQIMITGEVLDGAILIYKIEFSYAG